MDTFKAMLVEVARMLQELEHEDDVPYMLICETRYLKATIDDMEQRMKKDCYQY